MNGWNLDEPLADDFVADPPNPLASLVFLGRELRRRWRTVVVAVLACLCLATLYNSHYPPKSVATVTLSLQHPSGSDDTTAMQTDVAILETREVAGRTLAALGERNVPTSKFLGTYSATPVTSSVLTLTVKAANPRLALRTAQVLASTYLAYRADQERESADAQIAGVKNQMASLQGQLATAQAEYQQFKNDPSGAAVTTEALQQVNTLRAQIGSLDTNVQAAQGATDTLIKASVVLDPAAVLPAHALKHKILLYFTGAFGGFALGAGIIVLSALTSTRLRRREDVALAAGAPVTHSARRVSTRIPSWGGRLPHLRPSDSALSGLQVLAHGLETIVDQPGVHRTALVTLENENIGVVAAAFAGARLSSDRRAVFLVDLSERGRLEKRVRRAIGAAARPSAAPTVYRPDGPPAVARGPLAQGRTASSEFGKNDPLRKRWESAEVVIAVAPVNFDAGLDHLRGWADSAVLLVTAGESTAEQVSTAAGLIRSAGLELEAVLMVGTDRSDQSFGRRLATDDQVSAGSERQARM